MRAGKEKDSGAISSAQALASVVAATVGMGNIAGVAIAIAMGGAGAVFWMWVSALVGMCTKYHEGVLAIRYRTRTPDGRYAGGPMHIITQGLGDRWKWLAVTFAVAGLFGTLCIMNANQLTEAIAETASGAGVDIPDFWLRLAIGIAIAVTVSAVVLGGITRIARVATVMVPFMVGAYFILVLFIIATNITQLPDALKSIFTQAFDLRAGWGALAGVAIIGARRAALVNDAGVGTASLMHSTSANREPVREGLVAMLGPAIDSGFVCTLTALAILLGTDIPAGETRGLSLALSAFSNCIPAGNYLLTAIVTCFALSSMFTYSFYGTSCAVYLFGKKKSPPVHIRLHTQPCSVCRGAIGGSGRILRPLLCPYGVSHYVLSAETAQTGQCRNKALLQRRMPHQALPRNNMLTPLSLFHTKTSYICNYYDYSRTETTP